MLGDKPRNHTVSLDRSAACELLGGAQFLSQAELRFLDSIGNRNDRFDVGDFRAFLQATGQLKGDAASAEEEASGDGTIDESH